MYREIPHNQNEGELVFEYRRTSFLKTFFSKRLIYSGNIEEQAFYLLVGCPFN